MITIQKAVVVPLAMNGKQVGKTTVPAGSEIEITSREGDKVQIRFRNLEPVWMDSSALTVGDGAVPVEESKQSPAAVAFDAQKAIEALDAPSVKVLTSILEGRRYPDPSRQGELETALAAFVDGKARLTNAQKNLPKFELEAKRLRRNADVTGKPNPLNPDDNSGMERAEKLRQQANELEEQSRQTISEVEDKVAEARASLASLIEDWGAAKEAVREEEERSVEEKEEEEAHNSDAKVAPDGYEPKAITDELSEQSVMFNGEQSEHGNDFDLAAYGKIAAYVNGKTKEFEHLTIGAEEQAWRSISADAKKGVVAAQCVAAWNFLRFAEEDNDPNSPKAKFGAGRALDLLQKAADTGFAPAQYMLGLYYLNGWGGSVNTELGRKWISMAADQGSEQAQEKMKEIPAGDDSQDDGSVNIPEEQRGTEAEDLSSSGKAEPESKLSERPDQQADAGMSPYRREQLRKVNSPEYRAALFEDAKRKFRDHPTTSRMSYEAIMDTVDRAIEDTKRTMQNMSDAELQSAGGV